MNIDLTNSIHTISPKTVRNIIYKNLADRYKIENLRKYIQIVTDECAGRICTINDVIEEVEKRIANSPTALKEKRKRGRPLKISSDELADLFKKSVQVVESVVKPKRTKSVKKTDTTTKPLKNSSDELADLFQRTVQVAEPTPSRRTVKIVRRTVKVRSTKKVEPTSTKTMDKPINKNSSDDSQPRKMTRSERATRRAAQKDTSDLASMLTKFRF